MSDEQHWSVRPGPDGPVEMLTTFVYMRHWLRNQYDTYPHRSPRDLLIAWCREHPEPTLDTDPRGDRAWARSVPISLDGGGFFTVCTEEHVQESGDRKVTVQILRLPHRALSWREAHEMAEEILRAKPPES